MKKAEDLINELKDYQRKFPCADVEKEAMEKDEEYMSGMEWERFWKILKRLTYTCPLSGETRFFGDCL